MGADRTISIHAPRTGSDKPIKFFFLFVANFNPRSPHGERRDPGFYESWDEIFQSTLPARGATYQRPSSLRTSGYFNPRSPHGERQRPRAADAHGSRFQSTLPARGATTGGDAGQHRHRHFNPRSPHGERRARAQRTPTGADFNPRSPHGERPGAGIPNQPGHDISIHAPRTGSDKTGRRLHPAARFQSTLPARGATSILPGCPA